MTPDSDAPMVSGPWEQERSVRLALLLQAFGREFNATFPFPWSLAFLAYLAFVAPLAWLPGLPSCGPSEKVVKYISKMDKYE